MIKLLVDEAYAFDYLSILHVKKLINDKVESTWKNCFYYIENQLGKQKMSEIIRSKE